jgi:hypothetical protein
VSGTFDYFTLAIVGTQSSSRMDYTNSEDDAVLVKGVADDPNALGYFGYAYYLANRDKLKLVSIDSGKGCVVPSADTVADGTYQPLSRPIFIYVSVAAAKKSNVAKFVDYYMAQTPTLSAKVGYIALPDEVNVLARKRWTRARRDRSSAGADLSAASRPRHSRTRTKSRAHWFGDSSALVLSTQGGSGGLTARPIVSNHCGVFHPPTSPPACRPVAAPTSRPQLRTSAWRHR